MIDRNACRLFSVCALCLFFPVLTWGQSIVGHSARITDLGNCEYKVEGQTLGHSNSGRRYSVSVDINWSISGYFSGQSFSDSASDTVSGTDSLEAKVDVTKRIDSFDDWTALMLSRHLLNGGILHNIGETYPIICQYFVDNSDACTEEITKAVDNTPCNHSPIVIDLLDDGFAFSGPDGAVLFDLYAGGEPILLQWVVPGTDDAFLALDANGNGIVDDGAELFGNGTPLLTEGNLGAPNGFVALAQYDAPALGGNDDGQISEADAVWPYLRLWLDEDADGHSTPREMHTLEGFGIHELETIPRETNWWDAHLNWLRYLARASGDHDRLMVDVFFREVF